MKSLFLAMLAIGLSWSASAHAECPPSQIIEYYTFYLDRTYDAAGLDAWASSGLDCGTIAYDFAHSTEAYDDIANNFYGGILGRAPESVAVVNAWQDSLTSLGYLAVRHDFAFSAEGMNKIIQAYETYLLRQPESQDAINGWASYNEYYGLASTDYAIGTSQEAQNDVTNFYVTYLLRQPEAGAVSYWVNYNVANGLNAVANGIALSAEAQNDVTYYYAFYLLRAPEAGAVNYWINVNRADGLNYVKVQISESTEAQNDVTYFYQLYLQRQPEAGAVSYWVAQNYTIGLAAVKVDISNSTEARNDVAYYYSFYLGRAASAAEITGWTNFSLTYGLALAQKDIAESGEAANDITVAFQQILKRNPSSTEITNYLAYNYQYGLTALRYTVANSQESRNIIFADFYDLTGAYPSSESVVLQYVQIDATGGDVSVRDTLASGATVQAELTALYQKDFGRNPTAAELAACATYLSTHSLAAGASYLYNLPEAVAYRVSTTCQAETNAEFNSILKRSPTAAELSAVSAACVTAVDAGGNGTQTIDGLIANSDDGKAEMTALFTLVLGRAPTSSELSTLITDLTKTGYLGVAVTLSTCPAAVQEVITAFDDVLDRDPDQTEAQHYEALLASVGIAGVQNLIKSLPEAQEMADAPMTLALGEAAALEQATPSDQTLLSAEQCSTLDMSCVNTAEAQFLKTTTTTTTSIVAGLGQGTAH